MTQSVKVSTFILGGHRQFVRAFFYGIGIENAKKLPLKASKSKKFYRKFNGIRWIKSGIVPTLFPVALHEVAASQIRQMAVLSSSSNEVAPRHESGA